jgi:hypothetical protein
VGFYGLSEAAIFQWFTTISIIFQFSACNWKQAGYDMRFSDNHWPTPAGPGSERNEIMSQYFKKMAEFAAKKAPDGFVWGGAAEHPTNGRWAVIVRSWATGIYAMWDGQSMMSVPQSWAREWCESNGSFAASF